MADDGMLLNFSTDAKLSKVVPKFKGGSWRERLQAKRTAQRGGRRRRDDPRDPNSVPLQQSRLDGRNGASEAQQSEDFPDARPAKRRRENGHLPSSAGPAGDGRQTGQRRPNDQKAIPGSREVISSLFTYNPKPSSAVEDTKEEIQQNQQPAAPSNAPLVDGIHTFTSLGLSPTVATHLLTKMYLENPTAIQKAAVSQMLKEDSDAFIQSETGSGKTLAYLLPLVQRIMTMTEKEAGVGSQTQPNHDASLHRDSGLFAIILAPTRELCKQISVVLERLLGCAHYIVAGTVIGGEKKKSEKARLRKGLNILVATPGRLVDHLENTKVLDVSNVRWLVLDEGDRLMDLGFEEDITKIVGTLDQKKRKSRTPGLPEKRMTVLCSATLKMNVQKLGEISLKDAVLIKGDSDGDDKTEAKDPAVSDPAFLAPAQLKQSYLVVAAKLRFVTLTALLKRTFARKGSVMKAIVFVSCADSVEFLFKVFAQALQEESGEASSNSLQPADPEHGAGADEAAEASKTTPEDDSIVASPTLSSPQNKVTLYKLHGSLPQATRTRIVKAFAATTTASLLIATDVASRGLDLPNLDLVIEYDPAFSGDDHLHRIGRTARLGRDGRAVIFLLPGKEEGYVEVLKRSYRQSSDSAVNVTHTSAEEILKRGLSPRIATASKSSRSNTADNWEARATTLQLSLERWVLSATPHKDLARRAFQSHVRAYATHVAAERQWFDIKELHLGHLCKSFGLRDAPGGIGVGRTTPNKSRRPAGDPGGQKDAGDQAAGGDVADAAKKMKDKVRANRRLMMGAGAADEFNIA